MRSSFITKKAASSILRVLPEVTEALSLRRPVVALESTILAHGLPHPENIELAKELSYILRSKGVVPATVAIKDGIPRVGLSEDELYDLTIAGVENRADKCSTRDLPLVLARDWDSQKMAHRSHWGATTVASTMRLAHLAGISTFVTGGTGGVHRGGESSMDVSADLTELSQTPVVVVSAGIKSILDIRRTLEMLETLGVPTVAYQTDEFPAFFSPKSGVKAPARVECADEVARAYWASRDMNFSCGMLVAVPNLDPAGDEVEDTIKEALAEAQISNIEGRDVTPFVLRRVAERSGGDSLRSNTSLVKRNVEIGGDIAKAISTLSKDRITGDDRMISFKAKNKLTLKSPATSSLLQSRVIVMGGTVVDIVAKPQEGKGLILGTSNPGYCFESDGGVGRNVAEVLGRLGAKPLLFSAVGNDSRGISLMKRLEEDCGVLGVSETIDIVDEVNTATYLAILNSEGDLHTAIADMEVLREIPVPYSQVLTSAEIIVLDANPPVQNLLDAVHSAVRAGVKVAFEPTSVPKAAIVARHAEFLSALTYTFPNLDELLVMADGWKDTENDLNEAMYDNMKGVKDAASILLNQMNPISAHIIVTLGENGVLLASKVDTNASPQYQHFPAEKGTEVRNSTGAGDTLCGAFVNAILDGKDEATAVKIGMNAAMKSLMCSDKTISTKL